MLLMRDSWKHQGLCAFRRWASEHMKKKLTGTGGPALVSAYNVMTQVRGILL